MKFSIRDLLLVTVIVALAVGWWVDRGRLAIENRRLENLHENDQEVLDQMREWVSKNLPTSSVPAPNPSKP
jgi:hypothetical protein